MTGILHTYIPNRVIDSNGISDGASIAFYTTGTTTPATIYTSSTLSTPRANPVVVGAGAAVPDIWLDPAVTYRRVITYSDGSTLDTDPWQGLAAGDIGLPALSPGGVARTVQAKMRDIEVSPEDFGAVGDVAEPAVTDTTATGTDDILALEKARDYLVSIGGGRIKLAPGKYYGISRDFVIEANNVSIEGQNSRGCGIVALTSGTFTKAVVRVGGAATCYSNVLQHFGVWAPQCAKPALLMVGAQENVVVDEMVIVGSTDAAFVVWSSGHYLAGAATTDICHKARFTNLHIVTGSSSTGRGVELVGCDDCTFDNWTVTTPTAGGAPSVLGSIGLEIGTAVYLNDFRSIYAEGFQQPFLVSGTDTLNNKYSRLGATSIPSPAGTSNVFKVTGTNFLPLRIDGLSSEQGDYTNMVSIPGLSLTVAAADVLGGVLGVYHVLHYTDVNALETFVVLSDLAIQEGRPVYFTDRVKHRDTALTVNSTTPSVAGGNWFTTANNAGTAITDFTNGVNGQMIHVQVLDANTTIVNGAGLITFGGKTLTGNNRVFTFLRSNSVWKQIAGSRVPEAAIGNITSTATSGSLPTPNGSVTIADAATPTVTELLEYCVELEAKTEALIAALTAQGLTL